MFRAEILRRLREKLGLSQADLMFELSGVGLRVTRTTILNWEAGRTEPKASQVYKIAKFFRVPLDKLFS
ncbi:MAG: helix-turn-helix transcriptional regulator [Candidatus Omnitrophota bacterium]